MRNVAGLALAVLLLTPTGCTSETTVPTAATTTSTTLVGDDRLPAPDLGCDPTRAGTAIDYTGGADTIEGAMAVSIPDKDARVVTANERYAWVVSPSVAPTERHLLFNGGSGWSVSLTDRCFGS